MRALEQLALRCLMPGFVGTTVPEWVRRRAELGLGGVVLYARNIESPSQLAALTASLHAERSQLLVATDEEGGDVTRLEAATGSSYPGNRSLGVANDRQLTFEVAKAMGSDLARAGIDLDLAPDADVNSNPLNPVIGVRSFGANPEAVAAQTAAWVSGLQSAGVAACAKHFPGHGDVAVDSHLERVVSAADPHEGALAPFQAAVASDVKAIMSAHVVVRAIDDVPATVSKRIMTGLLRDELGFRGLAISDGLEMRGLTDGLGLAEAAVLALIAGCDALCIGGGLAGVEVVDEIAGAIAHAVSDRRLPEARLAEAASRVDAVAEWRANQLPPPPASGEVGLLAARRGLIVDGSVGIGKEAVVLQLQSTPSIPAGQVPWGITEALAARGVRVVAGDASSATGKSLVVVVRDLHRCPAHLEKVEAVLDVRPDAIVVEMGLPVLRPKRAAAYVATNGAARINAIAASEVMA